MARSVLLQLPVRPRAAPMRALAAVVLPAAATATLPMASLSLGWTPPAAALALVALIGSYAWLIARATVEHRLAEIAFVTALATALFAPGGGSLLVPAALAILRYRAPAAPRHANDNQAIATDGWVPVTAERAKLFFQQSAA